MERATDDEVREYLRGLDPGGFIGAGSLAFELGRDAVDLRKFAGRCFDDGRVDALPPR